MARILQEHELHAENLWSHMSKWFVDRGVTTLNDLKTVLEWIEAGKTKSTSMKSTRIVFTEQFHVDFIQERAVGYRLVYTEMFARNMITFQGDPIMANFSMHLRVPRSFFEWTDDDDDLGKGVERQSYKPRTRSKEIVSKEVVSAFLKSFQEFLNEMGWWRPEGGVTRNQNVSIESKIAYLVPSRDSEHDWVYLQGSYLQTGPKKLSDIAKEQENMGKEVITKLYSIFASIGNGMRDIEPGSIALLSSHFDGYATALGSKSPVNGSTAEKGNFFQDFGCFSPSTDGWIVYNRYADEILYYGRSEKSIDKTLPVVADNVMAFATGATACNLANGAIKTVSKTQAQEVNYVQIDQERFGKNLSLKYELSRPYWPPSKDTPHWVQCYRPVLEIRAECSHFTSSWLYVNPSTLNSENLETYIKLNFALAKMVNAKACFFPLNTIELWSKVLSLAANRNMDIQKAVGLDENEQRYGFDVEAFYRKK